MEVVSGEWIWERSGGRVRANWETESCADHDICGGGEVVGGYED